MIDLLSRFFKMAVLSYLVVIFTMILLPAFLVTEQLDLFQKIISYFSE